MVKGFFEDINVFGTNLEESEAAEWMFSMILWLIKTSQYLDMPPTTIKLPPWNPSGLYNCFEE